MRRNLKAIIAIGAISAGGAVLMAPGPSTPAPDKVIDITRPGEGTGVVIFRNCGVEKVRIPVRRELVEDARGQKTERVSPAAPLPPAAPANPACADHKVTAEEMAEADRFLGLNPADRTRPPDSP